MPHKHDHMQVRQSKSKGTLTQRTFCCTPLRTICGFAVVNASSSSGQLIAQGDYIPKIDKYMVDAPLRVTNLNSSRHCITFVTTEKKNNCCVFLLCARLSSFVIEWTKDSLCGLYILLYLNYNVADKCCHEVICLFMHRSYTCMVLVNKLKLSTTEFRRFFQYDWSR